jgi:hypothetical protein
MPLTLNNIPILLVEEGCETVRSWSLCRANARESTINFLFRWYGTKINIFFGGDGVLKKRKELIWAGWI